MAAIEQVEQCWDALDGSCQSRTVMPAVYELRGDLEGLQGEHGGLTCTSSNARKVIEWSWARREKILFFPMNTWAGNTANKMASRASR